MRSWLKSRIVLGAVLLVLLTGTWLLADWWYGIPADAQAAYVGGQTCIACHQTQHDKWHGSDHDLAMQLATPDTVLGDFDDQSFDYRGTVSKLFHEGDKYFVTTDDAAGQMTTFPVKYTFGVRPLQQYMVEFPDGRVQVLPFCWDTKGERWFHIYQEDPHTLTPQDPTHWTGPGQNWNHTCAECHSTDLKKGYAAADDTFHTTWSDINVNCEACHGPGSLHVDMAKSWSPFWDRQRDYGLVRMKSTDNNVQLQVCAKCHSHRDSIYPEYDAGEDYNSHYRLSLLDTGLYYHDGQIREEDYVYGSFLQSLMYRKGIKCSDCHDPHTAKIKFPGNQLCGQCHIPAKYDTPGHHHHADGSAGAQCVDCHMPERTYMVVDPRRDHSIRMPRPDLSVLLGTPNACTDCHIEMAFAADQAAARAAHPQLQPRTYSSEDAAPEFRDYAAWLEAAAAGDEKAQRELDAWNQWAVEQTHAWYPARDPAQHFAVTLDAAMQGRLPGPLRPPGDLQDGSAARREEIETITQRLLKLAVDSTVGPIVRASAVSQFASYPTPATLAATEKALDDAEPLVREAAVRNLETFYAVDRMSVWNRASMSEQERAQLDAQLGALARVVAESLTDPVRAVRLDAARIASLVPREFWNTQTAAAFDQALAELKTSLMSNADQAPAWTTWAGVLERQNKLQEAEAAYRRALRQLPGFIPAHLALATLYNYQHRNEAAETLLRDAIAVMPSLPEVHYSLGLLLAEDPNRLADAQKELAAAAKLAPDEHRIRYNNGLALQQLGFFSDAEAELLAADKIAPDTLAYRVALMRLYEAWQQWGKALEMARSLRRLAPGDPTLEATISEFERRQSGGQAAR